MPLSIRIQLWILRLRRKWLNGDITECAAHINELQCYMQMLLENDDNLRQEEIDLEIQLRRHQKIAQFNAQTIKLVSRAPKQHHQQRRAV